jgi:hypothetical protein
MEMMCIRTNCPSYQAVRKGPIKIVGDRTPANDESSEESSCTTRTSASGVSLPKWVEGKRTVRSGQALICALAEASLPNSLAFGASLNVDIGTRF